MKWFKIVIAIMTALMGCAEVYSGVKDAVDIYKEAPEEKEVKTEKMEGLE